ncbi:MAG: TlyA family RNA methyltransferase, partial [Solirubrobacteraceae bacterium]
MGKQRLDTLMAERGLFESRSRAAASVMAGEVRVGATGRRAEKPGEMVAGDVEVSVAERPRYVSRGGIKLENALARTEIAVAGRVALDVGASTGGFSDCLLQHGAATVVAVDVGYGELHYRLRTDPRVHVLERTNARALEPAMLPVVPNLAVVDVSFISLTKV